MMPQPCLETLCVRRRQLQNLWAHNERFNRTRRVLWRLDTPARLEDHVDLPDWLQPDRTYKCRVTYGPAVFKVEFEPYTPRPVSSLKLLTIHDLDYACKYANRRGLNELFARRGPADDVLLVRDGLLTDTSYANVALFDGNSWFTPAKPLLEGTKRADLLARGSVAPADIRPQDLSRFQAIKLINAMLDWDETPVINCSSVSW